MMPSRGHVAVILCLVLLLTGCAELTTMVINQLQPTPAATAAPVPPQRVATTQELFRESHAHPMVQTTMDLFDAEVTRVIGKTEVGERRNVH